ncbi:VIT1/CCC1 transporter family protein [Devriesea agamarum]|uniref:VIT1/CCC1 transporter family protein n=1 Tax=Devriesea agamarum TaxID=472569 RepID=UPI0009FFED8B|nr:VIT family protein [Devriesea agamarum]
MSTVKICPQPCAAESVCGEYPCLEWSETGEVRFETDVANRENDPQNEIAKPEAELVELRVSHDRSATSRRLNQLRAGVLGANDGIVSVASIVIGVVAATSNAAAIAVAGVAALSAGALSMAVGEYVSVSTQKDTEQALFERTRVALATDPHGELVALTDALVETGIPRDLASEAATRMTAHDALDAHSRVRFGIEEASMASPGAAACASLGAFALGGLIPLLASLLTPAPWTIPMIVVAVILALAATGFVSSKLGQAASGRATIRTIVGGILAMAITFGIGSLLGVGIA